MATSARAVVDVDDQGCDAPGCSGGSEGSFLFQGSTLVGDSYKKHNQN